MFKKLRESIKYKVEETKNLYGFGLNQALNEFSGKLNGLFIDREFFDDQFFDDFEEQLIELDILPVLAIIFRDKLEKKILNQRINKENFNEAIFEVITETVNLEQNNEFILNPEELNVVLIMGVNGVGKTTTISKLMNKYKTEYNLEVVAADTFRAGAIEQLDKWSEKLEVPITKTHSGHSPSAVVYEGITSAVKNKRNLLICDTAGRLHNQEGLMEELKKINKVIRKYPEMENDLNKPYKIHKLLVLDGTAGKNTINQAQSFDKLTDVSGVIVTKMDANSKVGMLINIAYEINKPIFFLTSGEQVEKINEFNSDVYLKLLLGIEE